MFTIARQQILSWSKTVTQSIPTPSTSKWKELRDNGTLLIMLLGFLLTAATSYVGSQIQYTSHTAVMDEKMADMDRRLTSQATIQEERSNKIEAKVDLLSNQQLTTFGAVKELQGGQNTLIRQLTSADPKH
jgi:hypothetical protein